MKPNSQTCCGKKVGLEQYPRNFEKSSGEKGHRGYNQFSYCVYSLILIWGVKYEFLIFRCFRKNLKPKKCILRSKNEIIEKTKGVNGKEIKSSFYESVFFLQK